MTAGVELVGIIAARRQQIRDSAPCEGCGTPLAACKANQGKDPTAPDWFGCCAQGLLMTPCRHFADPAALETLLNEIESGAVRTVDEITSAVRPFPRRRRPTLDGVTMPLHAYLYQGRMWKPKDRDPVSIYDMDEAWRFNATRWLERKAATLAANYVASLELSLIHFDASDDTFDSVVRDAEVSAVDPLIWIRGTDLYRALSASLPTGDALVALAGRARHWSTCPARLSAELPCTCAPPAGGDVK